jgi:hypothetical protein
MWNLCLWNIKNILLRFIILLNFVYKMNNPILSIVIPTRNRYEYLYHSLLIILKYYSEQNIEVM